MTWGASGLRVVATHGPPQNPGSGIDTVNQSGYGEIRASFKWR